MSSREQIAAALQRLDARDREVLDLSLRRRVPDDALGELYDWQPGEVAQRRATAIERLSSDLGVQRGAELGDVLKGLLEPETWQLVAAAFEEAAEQEPEEQVAQGRAEAAGGGARLAAVHPIGPSRAAEPEPEPEEPREPGDAPDPAEPEGPAGSEPVTPAQSEPVATPAQSEPVAAPAQSEQPVLDMLAGRPPPAAGEPPRPREGGRSRALRLGALAVMVAAGVGALAVALLDGDVGGSSRGSLNQSRSFVPAKGKGATGAQTAPFPTDARAAPGYPTAYVRRATTLYRSPGGKRLVRIARQTEWGSPRVLGVVRREGGWLAVQAPELPNGKVGWIPAEGAQLDGALYSVRVDLSQRELVVRKDGRTVKRMTVAVGQPDHPTPVGRYSVTDKLNVKQKGSPYGCCVVALTGHQTKLPPDWPGGDRLAIHATTDMASIGSAVSLGCMRATSSQARYLVRRLPIGSPVFVSR